MNSQRLSWRIGLPFALFVLVGSVLLVMWMGWHFADVERTRFERLAQANADFINRTQLPASERMAMQLRAVIGAELMFQSDDVVSVGVYFRRAGELIPEPAPLPGAPALHGVPADGTSHRVGALQAVAVPLASGHDLMLVRAAFTTWRAVLQRTTLAVLIAFWLLAAWLAWIISRGLVRPLRHLAARLPDIEKPGPIDLPEAERSDEIGDVARSFARTREALQQERAEREHAEKLAVLGRMTAALAHEIQNPVAAIKMHAQLWQGDSAGETAQIIEQEAARIESLVNQWMYLSKPQPPVLGNVDISALLAQTARTHQPQLAHAQVRLVLDAGVSHWVRGDVRRLAQVFSNLLVNAIQAMPRGGDLTITCSGASAAVEIVFTDTGRGFSPEALARCSEFFFSEKEGGMGIGLSVAHEIVKAHGGELTVANLPEGGASVTVSLPVLHTTPPSPSPQP